MKTTKVSIEFKGFEAKSVGCKIRFYEGLEATNNWYRPNKNIVDSWIVEFDENISWPKIAESIESEVRILMVENELGRVGYRGHEISSEKNIPFNWEQKLIIPI